MPNPPRMHLPPRGAAASLGLHALGLAALLLASPLRPLEVPPPRAVTVEIVTPEAFAALAPSAPEPPAPAAPAETASDAVAAELPTSAPDAPTGAAAPATHEATQFYASHILAGPGMARIRKTFGTLATGEQMVQLCNIEGLEQIRRVAPQYDPDTLVPYAMADMATTGLTLVAPGGAFRSRRRWYAVSFRCAVAADMSAVTGFSFALGAPIPPEQWEAHNLNAEDAGE